MIPPHPCLIAGCLASELSACWTPAPSRNLAQATMKIPSHLPRCQVQIQGSTTKSFSESCCFQSTTHEARNANRIKPHCVERRWDASQCWVNPNPHYSKQPATIQGQRCFVLLFTFSVPIIWWQTWFHHWYKQRPMIEPIQFKTCDLFGSWNKETHGTVCFLAEAKSAPNLLTTFPTLVPGTSENHPSIHRLDGSPHQQDSWPDSGQLAVREEIIREHIFPIGFFLQHARHHRHEWWYCNQGFLVRHGCIAQNPKSIGPTQKLGIIFWTRFHGSTTRKASFTSKRPIIDL